MPKVMVLPLVLLIIGIAMFFLEALIPSMGLLTILALVCSITATILAFQVSTTFGVICVIAIAVSVPLAVVLFFKLMAKTNIVLKEGEKDFRPMEPKDYLIGKEGVAVTYLRPSGVAMINGNRFDVTAENDLLDEGTRIKVVSVEGFKVIVREVKAG